MHPRRLANYKPLSVRMTLPVYAYFDSLRREGESNSGIIARILEERREQQILNKWGEGKWKPPPNK